MLDSHEHILPLDKVRFGPFYDQVTVINLTTEEKSEVGAAELMPPMLTAKAKSPYILEPEYRASMYLISMLRQIYSDIPVGCMVDTQTRELRPDEMVALYHFPMLPTPISSCVMRCEFRRMSIFISTLTIMTQLHSSEALDLYIVQAMNEHPEVMKELQEHIMEVFNGQTEEK